MHKWRSVVIILTLHSLWSNLSHAKASSTAHINRVHPSNTTSSEPVFIPSEIPSNYHLSSTREPFSETYDESTKNHIEIERIHGEATYDHSIEDEIVDMEIFDFGFSKESPLDDLPCDDFWDLPPPPDFLLRIPPPPIPPFLNEVEEIFRQVRSSVEHVKELGKLDGFREETNCNICDWANDSTSFWLKSKETEGERSRRVIASISGVAAASALLGAVLMSLFLKFKKVKCDFGQTGVLWLIAKIRVFKFRDSDVDEKETTRHRGTNRVADESTRDKTAPNSKQSLADRFRRRSSSQAHLQPRISFASEQNTNEDVSADVECVYNDLSPYTLTSLNSTNTYSEIEDHHYRRGGGTAERVYENSGYILTESPTEPNDIHPLSSSTPSSAYYSDASYCEIQESHSRRNKSMSNRTLVQAGPFKNFQDPSSSGNANNLIPLSSICAQSHMQHLYPSGVEDASSSSQSITKFQRNALLKSFNRRPIVLSSDPSEYSVYTLSNSHMGGIDQDPNTRRIQSCLFPDRIVSEQSNGLCQPALRCELDKISTRPLPPLPHQLSEESVSNNNHFQHIPPYIPSEYI